MTKEALKLALKALEQYAEYEGETRAANEAITAIKEALAQPAVTESHKQEPVAWRALVSKFPQGTGSDWVYVTKPIMKDSVHNQPLYTTPPQRTWVGLTLDERIELAKDVDWAIGAYCEYAEKIEAKLKEKNT